LENQLDLLRGDWRKIVVMDAFRFDVFKQLWEEEGCPGRLREVWSAGCDTGVWINNTFNAGVFDDAVLVSNTPVYWKPHYRRLLPRLRRAIGLWRKWRTVNTWGNSWRGILGNTEVLGEALAISSEYGGDCRLLIHTIPPHLPYVTEEGLRFLERLKTPVSDGVVNALTNYGNKNGWSYLRKLYTDSARQALRQILDAEWLYCDGGFTVTADHGELIGELNTYGHPTRSRRHPVLRRVPWLELEE